MLYIILTNFTQLILKKNYWYPDKLVIFASQMFVLQGECPSYSIAHGGIRRFEDIRPSWQVIEAMDMSRKSKTDHKQPEQISGDHNTIEGNVSGGIIVQGRGANVTVQQSTNAEVKEISILFEKLYLAIQTRQEDPNVTKEEINETLKRIENEIGKGNQASQPKLQRWMEYLNNMAPDIVDVILASLGGPVSGITAVLKKVAERAREQAGSE